MAGWSLARRVGIDFPDRLVIGLPIMDDLDNLTDNKWHSFTPETINSIVVSDSEGVYLLIFAQSLDFKRVWVGRSDGDIRKLLLQRLQDLREVHRQNAPNLFKFRPFRTAEEAYGKECTLYHLHSDSGGIRDGEHPSPPGDTEHHCPNEMCEYHDPDWDWGD